MIWKRQVESLGSCGTIRASFSAKGFAFPKSVRRRPFFDNNCPAFRWSERPREPRCPESKTFRPALGNACPGFDSRRPGFQNSCPGLVNRCPDIFRHCLGFQTLAPFLKAFAPIFRRPRLFCNLLPVSYLRYFDPKPSTSN
jgi:hypothetical protein